MAALTRQQTKYVAPTLAGITERIFNNLDALKYLYRNEEQFAANTYKDVDENTLIPSVLFWADKDLHYTSRQTRNDTYVSLFTEFDPKVPLRGGVFKRTEIGYMLPEMLDREDDKKPGEDLTTKKQYYLPWYQDKSADIGDIHLRTYVDWHIFDFAEHFNDFNDYSRITDQVFASINMGINLVDRLCVDTFIISLFGGYLHTYPIGHPLYRFFSDNANNFTPDEGFSKNAAQFFNFNGKLAKKIKEISKWVQKWYKAKQCYLTNIVDGELRAMGVGRKIPDYKAFPPKTSTKEECLRTVRRWYLKAGANGKYTDAGSNLRRVSLYSLVSTITGAVRDLTQLDARNWCGHDFYAEDNLDKKGLPLEARYSDLLVFMNDEDLEEARYGLKGSPSMGVFTEAFNGSIERLEEKGVTMVGLNYIPPGNAAIIDRICFQIKEYYHSDNREYFAFHLVESRIKHVFKRPVLYEKVVARVIQPADAQQYAVPLYWGSKHLPFIVEKA